MGTTVKRNRSYRPLARAGQLLCVLAAVLTLVGPAHAAALDQDAAVKLGREYLDAHGRAERRRVAALLADYQGDIAPC